MKLAVTTLMLAMVVCCHCTTANQNNQTSLIASNSNKLSLFQMAGRRLKSIWTWVLTKGQSEDTVIGRCFGFARKLKMLMPLVIFKLGVIITILVFLTIFSMKTLGLLVTLLLINTGGIATKLAFLKGGEDSHKTSAPQNLHFHIHPKDGGNYHVGHSGPSSHGWFDKYDEDSIELDNNINNRIDQHAHLNRYPYLYSDLR